MTPNGTIRIKTKNLCFYKKSKSGWIKTKSNKNILEVINLFKSHNNLNLLIDKKNPYFLKGEYYKNKTKGARINVLPDGKKLTGAYSLFGKNLTIHDQKSNNHWDVIYKNPSGFCYLYTIDKIEKHRKNKYKHVKEFEEVYPKLKKNVSVALNNKKDSLALPMYTLIKTHMRIGNEIYYKAHGHKGLSTLKKNDVKINGNKVTFNFLGKDGVPQKLTEEFPDVYVKRLKALKTKVSNYVFSPNSKCPLHENDFKKAFKKYCGKEFYPHIVRSYYATSQTENFLKKKRTKKEVKDFLFGIANKLGHKHFNKKENTWKDNYNVTLHHYIRPQLINKINKIIH